MVYSITRQLQNLVNKKNMELAYMYVYYLYIHIHMMDFANSETLSKKLDLDYRFTLAQHYLSRVELNFSRGNQFLVALLATFFSSLNKEKQGK